MGISALKVEIAPHRTTESKHRTNSKGKKEGRENVRLLSSHKDMRGVCVWSMIRF